MKNYKNNYQQYLDADLKAMSTTEIDDSLRNLVGKGVTTNFMTNSGIYAAGSFANDCFIHNPFNLNLNALKKISMWASKLCEGVDYNYAGWTLRDTHDNLYVLEVWGNDMDYEFCFVKSVNIEADILATETKGLKGTLRDFVASLQNVPVEVDFIDVCIANSKYSEEGFHNADGYCESLLCTGSVGDASNTSHVVEGLSVISSKNGFSLPSENQGKYALLVVQ